MSLDRIKYTRVGLVGGQRICFPLFYFRALLSSLATSRPLPTVQATALLRDTGLNVNVFLRSRTDAAVFSLFSLTRLLEDAPLGFLLYSSAYPA